MKKLKHSWENYSPFFHIAGWITIMIFTAGITWANVSTYDERISKLEGSVPRLENNLAYLMGKFNLEYDWGAR